MSVVPRVLLDHVDDDPPEARRTGLRPLVATRELQTSLFEPFRRGDPHAPTGAGIGLSIVAKFADLHGGRAWVSDREGGGASFSVLVRPQPPDVGTPEPPSEETTAAPRSERRGRRTPPEVLAALDRTTE